MSILDSLKKAIEQSGLPYTTLAKRAGISPSIIVHFLKDNRIIRLDTADAIASSIGLELKLIRTRKIERNKGYTRTTTPGWKNDNNQVVLRATGKPGNTRGQKAYELRCSLCDFVYSSNGADIWQRKCPRCQGGRP